jgi:hypothetical protein
MDWSNGVVGLSILDLPCGISPRGPGEAGIPQGEDFRLNSVLNFGFSISDI